MIYVNFVSIRIHSRVAYSIFFIFFLPLVGYLITRKTKSKPKTIDHLLPVCIFISISHMDEVLIWSNWWRRYGNHINRDLDDNMSCGLAWNVRSVLKLNEKKWPFKLCENVVVASKCSLETKAAFFRLQSSPIPIKTWNRTLP